MSTISTQLNWGTSYLVNDFYRRFVSTNASEQHYVWVSRVTTILLMMVGAIVTFFLDSIREGWEFVLESGAGIGLVLILRWYWWRVNAWSEISAMIAAAAAFAAIRTFTDLQFPNSLLLVVACTTIVWLVATFATAPEPEAHLIAFYRRVRPDGPGWRTIAARAHADPPGPIGRLLVDWVAGWVLIYALLFGAGNLILGDYVETLVCVAFAVAATTIIYRDLSHRGWTTVTT
jgi:Na+/proline symporter